GHDGSALWRFHFVLHLHCFNHGNAGSGFDVLTCFDKHAHNLSRHWRYDARGSVTMGAERQRATQTFRISERNSISIRASDHIEGGARLRTAFDPAIENLRVTNQQIMIVA